MAEPTPASPANNPASNSEQTSGLDSLLNRSVAQALQASPTPSGLLIGRIVALGADGVPLVECVALSPGALPAASLVTLEAAQIGQRVALMCADGDRNRPVILGPLAIDPTVQGATAKSNPVVRLDGKSLTFAADNEIVFQCGTASITLTKSGKVLIRGDYISSISTGDQRIKGGSVEIN